VHIIDLLLLRAVLLVEPLMDPGVSSVPGALPLLLIEVVDVALGEEHLGLKVGIPFLPLLHDRLHQLIILPIKVMLCPHRFLRFLVGV